MIHKNSVVTIAAIIALAASAALAAELHVGPGETYTTIQSAIDAATNGDTVIVADGTYTGDGNRDIDFNGKAITVRSENGAENCIIDCEATADEPHLGFLIFSDGVRIDGFTITQGRPKSDPRSGGISIDGGGIYVHVLSNVVVSNCVVTRNEGDGIDWHAYSVISDCVVSRNGGNGVSLGGGTLRRSKGYRKGLTGVSFGGGKVEDCVIYENGRGVSVTGNGEVLRCKVNNNRGEGIHCT